MKPELIYHNVANAEHDTSALFYSHLKTFPFPFRRWLKFINTRQGLLVMLLNHNIDYKCSWCKNSKQKYSCLTLISPITHKINLAPTTRLNLIFRKPKKYLVTVLNQICKSDDIDIRRVEWRHGVVAVTTTSGTIKKTLYLQPVFEPTHTLTSNFFYLCTQTTRRCSGSFSNNCVMSVRKGCSIITHQHVNQLIVIWWFGAGSEFMKPPLIASRQHQEKRNEPPWSVSG